MDPTAYRPKYEIPLEYQGDLEYVGGMSDNRSDPEILAALSRYQPITPGSTKHVWAFWHAGIAEMPGWQQRNVMGWVRMLSPSWTVRVLDTVKDSPNYALNYVPANLFPETFNDGTMDGPYVGQHQSDFIRTAVLTQHGGVYLDVGVLLIRHLDRLCWDQLSDNNCPYNVAICSMHKTITTNHFIASRKADPFIRNWHCLLLKLWEGRTNSQGLLKHPLLHYMQQASLQDTKDAGYNFEFGAEQTWVFEYAWQIICWERLTMAEDDGTGFNPAIYSQMHVLALHAMPEAWYPEMILGFEAQEKIFDLLKLPVSTNPTAKQAAEVVWKTLSKASMQKVMRGVGVTKVPNLGIMWDMPENANKDHEPGTLADLLRYGALHFRQTRDNVQVLPPPPKPRIGKLFEP